jgi:hypothetical protein
MSKFKMKLKLTGFELEIEGTREDIPLIAQNVGQQIAGLLQPAAGIVTGDIRDDMRSAISPASVQSVIDVVPNKRKKKKSTSSNNSTSTDSEKLVTVNWRHDPAKWNSPNQSWSTLEKSIWLLYVAEQETNQSELTVRQITDAFNTQFKQAKTVLAPNVTRDLGNKKSGKEALVGENITTSPSKWYLTESGKLMATNLISGLKV